jgi:F-type H+-transporting ATPase subunit b
MQIDWTTFALEFINFIALVWILKRFLYKPVLEVLNQRRAGINRTLTEAKETETRAGALKAQFENRVADWEKEKSAARAQFEAEMSAERARQLRALTKMLAQERERQVMQEVHRQQESRRELEVQALAQARAFATALLARLASRELEARLVDVFIEDLSKLPDAALAGLSTANEASQTRAIVTSAFPFSDTQRKRITEATATRLGRAQSIDFREDAKLLAGLRLSVGPLQLNMSLADELAFFAAVANHAG